MVIKSDIHTHTIASGHATTATITDMAKTAKAKNLEILGISDHGPATAFGGKPSYFRSLAQAAKNRLGIRMLYGAEVNILDNKGSLDLPDDILKGLDFTIASLHRPVKKPGSLDENTAAYIEAMKNPYVNVIGHPDDTHYPVDYNALVQGAIKHHVALEINDSSLRPDGYRGDTKFNDMMILNLCKHYRHPVLLASDSHGTEHVGEVEEALKLVALAEFPKGLIINTNNHLLLGLIAR
ncbi:putative hydrolase [Lachnospiraceae bacterium PF1-22]|uniref:phosphatase n=1 Tax=Ohessyouella blattaphilus TaxID=2949333 RepID=UPI003E1C82EF